MRVKDTVCILTNNGSVVRGRVTKVREHIDGHMIFMEDAKGQEYFAREQLVIPRQIGEAMQLEPDAARMIADGYHATVERPGLVRIYCAAKHGLHGGYHITWDTGRVVCTCQAYHIDGWCKHVICAAVLIDARAAFQRERKAFDRANRLGQLAELLRTLPIIRE